MSYPLFPRVPVGWNPRVYLPLPIANFVGLGRSQVVWCVEFLSDSFRFRAIAALDIY